LGRTSQDIADELGISVKTVEGHRANLMAKLGLRDLPALVRLAIRTGLIGLE
jgi:DNA-binding CsgD family transcriptional regulator